MPINTLTSSPVMSDTLALTPVAVLSPSYLLAEDGSFFLLEDGTGFLLLESSGDGISLTPTVPNSLTLTSI